MKKLSVLCILILFALLVSSVLGSCNSAKGTADWHVEQGIQLFEQGDYEAAMLEYDEAIRLDPEYARAYYDRGTIYGVLGQHEQAIQEYSEAIRLDPEDAWAYGNRGGSYLELGEIERGIEDLDESIRLSPKEAISYAIRASAYTLLEMDSAAQQDIDRAVELGFDRELLEEEIERLKLRH
ncbi:tetratricopeptide repeat protein [Chloroflexota bacterium]